MTMASGRPYAATVSQSSVPSPLPDEAAAKPHHVRDSSGSLTGFRNPYPSYANPASFGSMIRTILWPLLTGDLKRPDTSPPTVPVVSPQWLPARAASPRLRVTWLGHACCYLEFPSGLRLLLDPVFEDRCSPLTFLGPKRYTQPPCQLADIPVLDAVLISHSHYDHLSRASILDLHRLHPDAHFFVGLGLGPWFRRLGVSKVTELDWWQDADLTVEAADRESDGPKTISARISCLPSQHTSGRSPFDRDATLWCSWAIRSGQKSVWFAGDTGYRSVPSLPAGVDDYGPDFASLPRCPQFEQIGHLRGPFDLGLIPIGAYYPRAAFSAMHANPFDAAEIFTDTRCQSALAIHWGTWALTMEEVMEPPKLLREALKRKGISETGVFDVCDIGASREY